MLGRFRGKRIEDVVFSSSPITVGPTATIQEALSLLNKNDIGSVVVVEGNNKAIGIFTERDFIRKLAGTKTDLKQARIQDYMTPSPVCYRPRASVLTALIRMMLGRFRHLVINGDQDQVIGVLSIKDLLCYLVYFDAFQRKREKKKAEKSENPELKV